MRTASCSATAWSLDTTGGMALAPAGTEADPPSSGNEHSRFAVEDRLSSHHLGWRNIMQALAVAGGTAMTGR